MTGIRVRMYRVGFGDCFLVTLTDDQGQRHHLLIDCGVHVRGDAKTMDKVVEDIRRETGGQCALVVATHSHQDHISGFGSHAEVFRGMSAREVWMPWVEDPCDPTACACRDKQAAMLAHLELRMAAWAASRDPEDEAALAAVLNLRGNALALDTLRRGFHGAKVRYLAATPAAMEDVVGIPGLTISVLGPPRDEHFLEMELPPQDDRFFRAAEGRGHAGNPEPPFSSRFVRSDDATLGKFISHQDRAIVGAILDNDIDLAFRLERAKNNTSLVLLISFAGHSLLFPGDAQYGSWESWRSRPDRKEILSGVSLYKVSHHGSVNATPRNVVQAMATQGVTAMMSTQSIPWPSIPDHKLTKALCAHATIIRTDGITELYSDWESPKPNLAR